MKKTNQQGRSMIEMLGVLSIIGVLTLGGIAGYKYAMIRYRANETIDEVNRWAIAIAPQLINNTTFNKEGLTSPSRMGYPLDANRSAKADHFEVVVSNVPVNVCETILSMSFDTPSAIYVDGLEITGDNGKCGQGVDAGMIFEFRKDFDVE